MESLPDGGYLAASSHWIHYDPAKMEAMEETVRTYGREVYARFREGAGNVQAK
jgi:hypothetical protein